MLTTGMFVADRYEIIEKIGAGGMSDVYKARDHILGRFVAIKVLKQEFSEDVNFVTKFRTEAQSAAGLEHPNIVNIYDVGSEAGMHFIVMEYVEGVTLKTYIEKKMQLTYKEAVSIAIQVGRGIEAAHAKNIIHRDIKPQNILISTEGKAKVTDFGIARAVSNNTISADVMGSVHYSSPEQARNGFVDGKSDIYSLGIVMYEMVTGRVPFDGDTTVAVAIQHLQEEMVAPSAYAPDLPVSLEKIILKCTQKSPDRRYKVISDLLVDLKQVLISPNEDFVTMIPSGSQNKTRVINESEVKAIHEARRVAPKQEERRVKPQPQPIYDEPEEDEDEEDNDGFLNPAVEKAATIGGIIAAFIIIGIIIYFVGNVLGIFGAKKPDTTVKDNDTEVVQTEQIKEDTKKDVINTEKEKIEQVTMIKVTGLTFEEAKTQLNAIGLGIKEIGTQNSNEYEEGLIMSQDVAEGMQVDKNTTINVYISSGEGTISIPNVVGYDNEAALNTLADQGFTAERTYAYSDTVASGMVISQNPTGGTEAKKGTVVTLTVSQGKEAVSVPDVYNKTQEEATNALTAAGLTVTSTTTDYSDTVEAGKVISQSIAAGKYVDAGSNISLVISMGKKTTYYYCKATITAPDNAEVTVADITLKDANGNVLQEWTGVKIAKFPYTISAYDIEEVSTGTLNIVWYLADGTSKEQTENVTFTKQ
ncbi:MAG: Stk1 family PASTA domain-containing Ser/Thr kinase [Lachnospiraceae bacterium]|nr:Stk1 family PASTA domain-containing Ser/Thr kinase [Lachnospiraceae bacterium]